MGNNKQKLSAISIYAIIMVVFVLLSIAVPFPKPGASWVMFAFSIVSLVAGLGISAVAFGKAAGLKSKFYGFPVFRIGVLYNIFQLSLTLLVYIVGSFIAMPYWVGLMLSVILLGAAAIGLIVTDNARDYVESVDTNTVAAIKTIKKFQVDIAFVLDSCKDPVAREPLKKLVEKFKYSDIVSNEATAEVEATIKTEVEELQKMLASSSTEDLVAKIDAISNLLSYRNRLCENSKTN